MGLIMRFSLVQRATVLAVMCGYLTNVATAQRSDTLLLGRLAGDTARTLRTIEVRGSLTGLGQTRTGNALDRVALLLAVPGTTALKSVARLPGVNYQGSDPFGLYEWANRVTMRGFQTQQVGQTFDALPLGDMSYGNFNGLAIGRAVDPENLGEAAVAQGTGALGTASSNNLGGVIQYASAEPLNARTFTLRQMFGSASARRSYGRFDTGLHPFGERAAFKGYLSFGRYDTDKWKGSGARFSPAKNVLFGQRGLFGEAGEQWMDQVNTKAQILVGGHRFTAFYNFSDKKESDFTDLSLRRFNTSGRDWDQLSDWRAAQAAATSQTPDEAYFHSAQGARRDHLGYLAAELQLRDNVRFDARTYAHTDDGGGDWHAPSYGSPFSPDPVYFRQTQYDNERYGVIARGHATLGGHDLEFGGWLERNESTIRRVAWRLRNYQTGPEVNFNNVLRLFFDRTGDFSTRTVFVQNTNRLLDDRLKLTYGAKYLYIDADFSNNKTRTVADAASAPDTARPNVSIPTDGGLLPQLGAVFSMNGSEQLFANYSQNVNAFPYSPQTGVYNTDPKAFQFFKDNTDPEKAYSYELGVRSRRAGVEASLAIYHIDYRNRLIGVAVCPLTATCVSSFANVGDITTNGVEALVSLRLLDGLSWTTSAALNSSEIADDYRSGSTTVAAKGKTVVDAPKTLANSSLQWYRGAAAAALTARHVGKRYFSILNDVSVPAYTTVDASLAYRLTRIGSVRELQLQLNAVNLADKAYIATMGTGGFTVSGDTQTLMAGYRRLVFLTVGTSF
jgi:iron complex outermembrane receptor protein